MAMSAASRSSFVSAIPPSPDVMILTGWKLNTVMSDQRQLPTRSPLREAPMEWEASSSTLNPYRCASSQIASCSRRLTAEMHWHDDLWQPPVVFSQAELLLQRRHAQVPGGRIDVDKVDIGAAIARAICRCDESIGNRPQQVARLQAQRQAGKVQGRSRAVDRHCVTDADQRRDCVLESGNRGTLRQKIGVQYGRDCINVRLKNLLAPIRNHWVPSRLFIATISATVRKCGFLPEWNSNPCSTGFPVSPRLLTEKSTNPEKLIDGLMTK